MPKPSSLRYRTTNWPTNNPVLRRRCSHSICLDPAVTWHPAKTGRRDHPEVFSEIPIQTCLILKILFDLPLREMVGLVASPIEIAELDWPVPDCSTLCRRQARLAVRIRYRRVDGPVTLIIDSIDRKFRGDDERRASKHGWSRRRQWHVVSIGMDAQTGDVRAVEFMSRRHGDRPILPALSAQLSLDEKVGSVTLDGSYDTRRCQGAIVGRGPEARIPTRWNGRAWKKSCPATGVRNEILPKTRHQGRANGKRELGYHVHSCIEARVNRLEAFGERIASSAPERQTVRSKIRIAIMNRYNTPGTTDIIAVA